MYIDMYKLLLNYVNTAEQNVMLDTGADLVVTKPVSAGDLESMLSLVK